MSVDQGKRYGRLWLWLSVFLLCSMFPFSSEASEAFAVKRFSPEGMIQGPTAITIAFSTPVVQSDDVGKALSADTLPIRISPRLSGVGKWADPLTFVYQPSMGYFREATKYAVEVDAGLKDSTGRLIEGKRTFELSTPALTFVNMRQTGFNLPGNAVDYQLLFSLPVSPSLLETFLSLRDEKGERIPYRFTSNAISSAINIRAQADNGSPMEVRIEKGLTSNRGPLGLEKPITVKISRDLSLKIQRSYVRNNYEGTSVILETTAQIDAEKVSSFIEIVPAKTVRYEAWDGRLRIVGDFMPRERVVVRLKKGLPAVQGPPLQEEWEGAFIFPDLDPSLSFMPQGYFASSAGEALMLPISSVNIEKLDVVINRIYDNNVPFLTRSEWPYGTMDLAEHVFSKTYQISAQPNEKVHHSIDLGKILGGRKGLFEISANRSDYWPYISRVINVTDIAGAAKVSAGGALVWAHSISAGTPVAGVQVTLYSRSNQTLASGTTNTKGLCELNYSEKNWPAHLHPSLVILQKEDDISVLRLDESIWRMGDPEYAGMPYAFGDYLGLCYTPRGVFRPGEKVPVQAIVRERNLSLREPFPVQLKITSSLGREWKTFTSMLSPMGMASEEFDLPDSAPTGAWRAHVYIPGEENPIAATSFMVEDFAPPQIAVEVSSDREKVIGNEQGVLRIFSKYLFGAPATALKYEVGMHLIPREYAHRDWKDFVFSDRRITSSAASDQEIATGALSAEGAAEVPYALEEIPSLPSVGDLVLRAGVMEDGGRWVYRSLSLPFYPREQMLGIKLPEGEMKTREVYRTALAAIDTTGRPLLPQAATASLYKENYRVTHTVVDGVRRSERRVEYLPVEGHVDKALAFDKDGKASLEVSFSQRGRYLWVTEDKASGAVAAVSFYVADERWAWSDRDATLPESLSIVLDKAQYKIGEHAKVKISGAFAGSVVMTVETDEVLYHDVAPAGEDGVEFTVPVTAEMMPNAWVTAHLVRAVKPEGDWSAHRAFGAVSLQVDCSTRKLDIAIQTPERLRTWKENAFSLQLRDDAGKGVKGEVALMLVDEGVMMLTRQSTPDYYAHYIKKRGLSIRLFDMYADLMRLYVDNPPPLAVGGGGMDEDAASAMQKASLSPVKAKRFKVLTLWKRVTTDENGHADFSFVLPTFTGKARLMAVAASEKAFGSHEQFFEVAQDVVSELALPRTLAPSDSFDAAIQLFNRTGKEIDATVEVTIEGPLSFLSGNNEPPSKKYQKKMALTSAENGLMLPLKMQADSNAGLATLTLVTSFPGDSTRSTTEIAVRPPFPRVPQTGAMVVQAGKTETIEIPSDWFSGTRRAMISMSGLPAANLSDVAKFLLDYPYYCLEQTVSGGWTLLSLPEIVPNISPALTTEQQLTGNLTQRILRIQGLQMYNGGFSSWAYAGTADWSSAYATHFLIECEKRGVPVSKEMLDAAISYLHQLMAVMPTGDTDQVYGQQLAIRAYIAYILTLKADAPLAWMAYLKDHQAKISDYGRFFLAAAYARAGQKQVARELLPENIPPILSYQPAEFEDVYYSSPLRTQAIYLLAWNELDPTSVDAANTAAHLLESLRKTNRYTTQEAGFALMSLANFYAHNAQSGQAQLTLAVPKGQVLAQAEGNANSNTLVSDDIKMLQIENTGTAKGYVSWSVDGVPQQAPIAIDKGIQARIVYYTSEGIPITSDSVVRRGDRLVGRITLSSFPSRSSNIVVALPLPGGFEIENPKLMDPVLDDSSRNSSGYRTSRAELRDDRLLLFVDNLYRNFKWEFAVRAVTSGCFTLPPIAAEGMYAPGLHSIGETSVLTIVP